MKVKLIKGYSIQSHNHQFRNLILKKSYFMPVVFFLIHFLRHLYGSQFWLVSDFMQHSCFYFVVLVLFNNQKLFLSYVLHEGNKKMKA